MRYIYIYSLVGLFKILEYELVSKDGGMSIISVHITFNILITA
jgi:hypothetical protein